MNLVLVREWKFSSHCLWCWFRSLHIFYSFFQWFYDSLSTQRANRLEELPNKITRDLCLTVQRRSEENSGEVPLKSHGLCRRHSPWTISRKSCSVETSFVAEFPPFIHQYTTQAIHKYENASKYNTLIISHQLYYRDQREESKLSRMLLYRYI